MPSRYQVIELHHNQHGRQRVHQRAIARKLTMTEAAVLKTELATLNPRTRYAIRAH